MSTELKRKRTLFFQCILSSITLSEQRLYIHIYNIYVYFSLSVLLSTRCRLLSLLLLATGFFTMYNIQETQKFVRFFGRIFYAHASKLLVRCERIHTNETTEQNRTDYIDDEREKKNQQHIQLI